MKKRILSVVLALCLIVGMCPVFASASAAFILKCTNFSSGGLFTQIHYGVNGEGDFGTIDADWSWDEKSNTLTFGGGEFNSKYDGIQLNCYHYTDDTSLSWDNRRVGEDATVYLKKGTTTVIKGDKGLEAFFGSLTIKGEGTLIVQNNGSSNGGRIIAHDKIIVDGATVIVDRMDQSKLTVKSGSVTIDGKTIAGNKPTPPPTPDKPTVGGFNDVHEGDYYADAVVWAVRNGVTNGIGEGKFGPGNSCTRGQIVTFLWNAAGKPEPKGTRNSFADVKASDYFYKAVLWAVENDITSGTGENSFSPNNSCTRNQAVTFLWRAEGKPTVAGGNVFTDVESGSYYEDAVNWAVANKITSGTSADKFSPGQVCTRGQIVTLLYRTK